VGEFVKGEFVKGEFVKGEFVKGGGVYDYYHINDIRFNTYKNTKE